LSASTEAHGLNTRSTTSLVLAPAFTAVAATGLLMYFQPHGAPPLLGLNHGLLKSVHVVSSFLAVVAAVIHLVLNWRPLLRYLNRARPAALGVTREAWVALAVLALAFAGAVWRVPPFGLLLGEEGHGGPPPGVMMQGPESAVGDMDDDDARPTEEASLTSPAHPDVD
jgi:hypothetical protein